MTASDHYTDPHGRHINVVPLQDELGPNCPDCGRTTIPRADGGTIAELWQHAVDCPEYLPHPDTIAGQPGYNPAA
jgi:hypothetical protein